MNDEQDPLKNIKTVMFFFHLNGFYIKHFLRHIIFSFFVFYFIFFIIGRIHAMFKSASWTIIWFRPDPAYWAGSDQIPSNDLVLTGSGAMLLFRPDPAQW